MNLKEWNGCSVTKVVPQAVIASTTFKNPSTSKRYTYNLKLFLIDGVTEGPACSYGKYKMPSYSNSVIQ